MKWYFKLEKDVELGMPTAWSGYVKADKSMNSAHAAILEKLGLEKMPSNTIVASQEDLINGRSPRKIARRSPPKPAARAPKAFDDVGMTFDQAEALLKKFGLKK